MVTGIVSLQAMVSQSSFRMGKLAAQAATLNAQYGQLKLSVAELSAPDRIAKEAHRIGLVLPQQVEIVTVPGPLRRGSPGPNTGVPSFALKALIGDEP
jgi:cell division protein FtsL